MTRRFAPVLVFFLAAGFLCVLSLGHGLSWDESSYFTYAEGLLAWVRSGMPFDAEALRAAWSPDPFTPW